MQTNICYRHRVVTDSDVAFIRQLVAEHPESSRRDLSKKLCVAWNWVQANGALRDMVCRGLMLKLHREALIELPPVRREMRNPGQRGGGSATGEPGRDSAARVQASAAHAARGAVQ